MHRSKIEATQVMQVATNGAANRPVIGLQIEGTAQKVIDQTEASSVIERYIAKYSQGKTFMERFSLGKNP